MNKIYSLQHKLHQKTRKKISEEEFKQNILPRIKPFYDFITKEARTHFSKIKILDNGMYVSKKLAFKMIDGEYLGTVIVRYKSKILLEALGITKNGKLTNEMHKYYSMTFKTSDFNLTDVLYSVIANYFEPFADELYKTIDNKFSDVLGGYGVYNTNSGYAGFALIPKIVKNRS
jgi:hypothetical protein